MELGEQKNGHNNHPGPGPGQQQSNNANKYKQSEPVGGYDGVPSLPLSAQSLLNDLITPDHGSVLSVVFSSKYICVDTTQQYSQIMKYPRCLIDLYNSALALIFQTYYNLYLPDAKPTFPALWPIKDS